MRRRIAFAFLVAFVAVSAFAGEPILVGVAEVDITPPEGFPMAGYYHERLAEGTIDPLKAKAIVFRQKTGDDEVSAALVVCDLIGVATDLSRAVRRQASEKTGVPQANIVLSATHSHTAPDYMKELWLRLGNEEQTPARAAYVDKLIGGPVEAIVKAYASAKPTSLECGGAIQGTPVSFNRRSVMRDGTVKTWQSHDNPEVIRAAGPIDPEIGLLVAKDDAGKTQGVLSNFALHLDTVGGMKWSADYPRYVAETIQQAAGADVVSIFAAGCCGDINHVDPRSKDRNKTDFIGQSLGQTIVAELPKLRKIDEPRLAVKSRTVELPLQDATREELASSIKTLERARKAERVDFFEHVVAYKKVILDQLRHKEPFVRTSEQATWGLSRSLAGIGDAIPVDVTTIALGDDLAIVALPGEVFVELGLAIKQGSPYRTTLVIELSNHVETIYVPHRAAYAGGSYEVTNSALQPGGGEMLVEAALELLRETRVK